MCFGIRTNGTKAATGKRKAVLRFTGLLVVSSAFGGVSHQGVR